MGTFPDFWTLRDGVEALEAKRADDWTRLGWELYWLVNTRPTFGSKPPPTIPMHKLNPFAKPAERDAAKIDAAFDAVWHLAPEGKT